MTGGLGGLARGLVPLDAELAMAEHPQALGPAARAGEQVDDHRP
jgi:hypothetical protein